METATEDYSTMSLGSLDGAEAGFDMDSFLNTDAEASALADQAKVLALRGKFIDAAELLREALLLAPQDAILHAKLVGCLARTGWDGEAAES